MSFTSSETRQFPRPSELQRYPSTLRTHTLNHPKRGIPVRTNTKKSGQRMYDLSRPNLCRPRHFGQVLQHAVIPGLVSCIMVSRSTWTQQFQHMDLEDEYKKGSVSWPRRRCGNVHRMTTASDLHRSSWLWQGSPYPFYQIHDGKCIKTQSGKSTLSIT